MAHPLPIRRVHHIEMIAGNARLTAFFCRRALGMDLVAYRGPETGHSGSVSYVLVKEDLRLVVTSPLTHEDPRVFFLALHGDSIKDIAFEVEDLDGVSEVLEHRGATFVEKPRALSDANGTVRVASVKAFGDTVHTFVARGGYKGPFLPGFEARRRPGYDSGIVGLDHFAVNVEARALDRWVEFYSEVLGFQAVESWAGKEVQTDRSALHSQVLTSPDHRIRLSVNEPATGRRRSQVQEFLDFHLMAGIQHLALSTRDVVKTVAAMKENGLEFLPAPAGYYDRLGDQIQACNLDRETLERLNILIDHDGHGCLLQAWTRPVTDRPTLFLEVIERRGADTFGSTSFRALFEAIEAEQARRGNL